METVIANYYSECRFYCFVFIIFIDVEIVVPVFQELQRLLGNIDTVARRFCPLCPCSPSYFPNFRTNFASKDQDSLTTGLHEVKIDFGITHKGQITKLRLFLGLFMWTSCYALLKKAISHYSLHLHD